MSWHDVWPKQRANVTRRKLSTDEREYRARVRRNKTLAATKAQSNRVSKERKERAKQRAKNAEIVKENKRHDGLRHRRTLRNGARSW